MPENLSALPEEVEAVAHCPDCDEPEGECRCTSCPNCDGNTTEEEQCSNCHNCPACDSCFNCDGCVRRLDIDDRCVTCEQCDSCCGCTRCSYGSCTAVATDDNDTYICSNCNYCEGRHCECSSCSNCGDRSTDGTCVNCDSCDDCCACHTCSDCEERSVDDFCTRCNRCSDCGCSCVVQDEEEDYVAPLLVDFVLPEGLDDGYVPAEVTFNNEHVSGTSYTSALCWDLVEGRPVVSHSFRRDSWGDNICNACHTCIPHCRANAVCSYCNASTKHHSVCTLCNLCAGHCNCITCHGCSGMMLREDACMNCIRHKEHCNCPKCSKCQKRGGICGWCGDCADCCRAEESECGAIDRGYYIPGSDYELTFHRPTNLLGFRKNPSRRELGIEIETNNITQKGKAKQLYNTLKKWSIAAKSDGSIGSFPEGIEYNLQPASGDKVIEQVTEVCEGLKKIGASPNSKCGIHVHVSAVDLRGEDLKQVIEVYARVEKALFDLCHPARLGGRYSEVCGNKYKNYGKTGAEVRRKLVKELVSEGNPLPSEAKAERDWNGYTTNVHKRRTQLASQLKSNKEYGNGPRYRALNLVSFFKRRTIEFRHYESTIDPVDVYNWALVVGEVINFCATKSSRQVAVLPNNSRKALLAVVPERLHAWIIDKWRRMDQLRSTSTGWQTTYRNYWGI